MFTTDFPLARPQAADTGWRLKVLSFSLVPLFQMATPTPASKPSPSEYEMTIGIPLKLRGTSRGLPIRNLRSQKVQAASNWRFHLQRSSC